MPVSPPRTPKKPPGLSRVARIAQTWQQHRSATAAARRRRLQVDPGQVRGRAHKPVSVYGPPSLDSVFRDNMAEVLGGRPHMGTMVRYEKDRQGNFSEVSYGYRAPQKPGQTGQWLVTHRRAIGNERTFQLSVDGERVESVLTRFLDRPETIPVARVAPGQRVPEGGFRHLSKLFALMGKLQENGLGSDFISLLFAILANNEDQSRSHRRQAQLQSVEEIALAVAIGWERKYEHAVFRGAHSKLYAEKGSRPMKRGIEAKVKERRDVAGSEFMREQFEMLVSHIPMLLTFSERAESMYELSDGLKVHKQLLEIVRKAKDPLVYITARNEIRRQIFEGVDQEIMGSQEKLGSTDTRRAWARIGRSLTTRIDLRVARARQRFEARWTQLKSLIGPVVEKVKKQEPLTHEELQIQDEWMNGLDRLRGIEQRIAQEENENAQEAVKEEVENADWVRDRRMMALAALEVHAPSSRLLPEADRREAQDLIRRFYRARDVKKGRKIRQRLAELEANHVRFVDDQVIMNPEETPEALGGELIQGLRVVSENLLGSQPKNGYREFLGAVNYPLALGPRGSELVEKQFQGPARLRRRLAAALNEVGKLFEHFRKLHKEGRIPELTRQELEGEFLKNLGKLAWEVVGDRRAHFDLCGRNYRASMLITLLGRGGLEVLAEELEQRIITTVKEKQHALEQEDEVKRTETLREKVFETPAGKKLRDQMAGVFTECSPLERTEMENAVLENLVRVYTKRMRSEEGVRIEDFAFVADYLEGREKGLTIPKFVEDLARLETGEGGPSFWKQIKADCRRVQAIYRVPGEELRKAALKRLEKSENPALQKMVGGVRGKFEGLSQIWERFPGQFEMFLRNFGASLARNVQPERVEKEADPEAESQFSADGVATAIIAELEKIAGRSSDIFMANRHKVLAGSATGGSRQPADVNRKRNRKRKRPGRWNVDGNRINPPAASDASASLTLEQRERANAQTRTAQMLGVAIQQDMYSYQKPRVRAWSDRDAVILPQELMQQIARDIVEHRNYEIRILVFAKFDGDRPTEFCYEIIDQSTTRHWDLHVSPEEAMERVIAKYRREGYFLFQNLDVHNHPYAFANPSDVDRKFSETSVFMEEMQMGYMSRGQSAKGERPTGQYYSIWSNKFDPHNPYNVVNFYKEYGLDWNYQQVPVHFIPCNGIKRRGSAIVYSVDPQGEISTTNNHGEVVEYYRRILLMAENGVSPAEFETRQREALRKQDAMQALWQIQQVVKGRGGKPGELDAALENLPPELAAALQGMGPEEPPPEDFE